MTPRSIIVEDFAKWTAFSSTRSGWDSKEFGQSKDRSSIYPLICTPQYGKLLGIADIERGAFDGWHEEAIAAIRKKAHGVPVGWAAKLINVYLKTRVYLAGEGCPALVKCLHPPIDSGLWKGIKKAFPSESALLARTHCVTTIKSIDKRAYAKIIDGLREVAARKNCLLIEVEQFWEGTRV